MLIQQTGFAQCACTSSVTNNNTSSYSVNTGQTLCINANLTYTGNITLNGGTLCNNGTVQNITFLSGTFNNYGNYVKTTGSVIFNNTALLTINGLPGSSVNINNVDMFNGANTTFNVNSKMQVTGNWNISRDADADLITINVKKGGSLNVLKDFNMSKGTLSIFNEGVVTRCEVGSACGGNINFARQFYLGNAAFNLNNGRGSVFNVNKTFSLDAKRNKTIINAGVINLVGDFNIGGNAANTGSVTLTNNGTINALGFVNFSLTNGFVTFTNNRLIQIAKSYSQSKDNTIIINNGYFGVTLDINIERGIITNNNTLDARDADIKFGTFTNNLTANFSRDLITSNNAGIINNNAQITVARELNNKATINLGVKSSIVTKDLFNLNNALISGKDNLAGDSTNYAYIEIARTSNNAGNFANYIMFNDLTPPLSGIRLDVYTNINKLGLPLIIIVDPIIWIKNTCWWKKIDVKITKGPYCSSSIIFITASMKTIWNTPFPVNTTFTFQPWGTVVGSPIGSVAFSGIVAPIISVSAKIVASNCIYNYSKLLNISTVNANAGADEFISAGTAVTLGGSPAATAGSGFYSYSWSPIISTLANPIVTPTTPTTYILTVIDSQTGCKATDDKLVYIIKEPYHFVLKKVLDAGYYNSFKNKIYFKFEEEYYDPSPSAQLNYIIVNDLNVPINTSTFPLIEKIGDNRFQLNLTTLGLTPSNYYRIKITNKKREVWYARFNYIGSGLVVIPLPE